MRGTQEGGAEGLVSVTEHDTVASTIRDCKNALMEVGIKAGIYILAPALHSQVSKRSVVTHFGFPDAFIQKYLDPEVFENDPIPDYVIKIGQAMSWQQAVASVKLPALQKDLFKTIANSGLVDGIFLPLFGPNGKNSFTSLLVDDRIKLSDKLLIEEIINISQFAHRKTCLLINRDRTITTRLSKRESEVIYWIARGKSNQDIGSILDISLGTVDTYVRRLYSKLEVNDRISAVLEGMGRGLVKI